MDSFAQARIIADHLKKKKIGRMTFLIKELIRSSAKEIVIVQLAPPQTKLIVELISCLDSDARDIVRWALGSTLVTG